MIQISKEAMQRWNQIPTEIQGKLLSNVFCSYCAKAVKIIDFKAEVTGAADLVLKGKCATCGNTVARLIEGE